MFERFFAHILESDWIENSAKCYTKEIGKWLVKDLFTKEPPPEFDIEKFRPFQGKVIILQADGDVFDLGGRRLEIIHTPDHSPGHISAYEEERGRNFIPGFIPHEVHNMIALFVSGNKSAINFDLVT